MCTTLTRVNLIFRYILVVLKLQNVRKLLCVLCDPCKLEHIPTQYASYFCRWTITFTIICSIHGVYKYVWTSSCASSILTCRRAHFFFDVWKAHLKPFQNLPNWCFPPKYCTFTVLLFDYWIGYCVADFQKLVPQGKTFNILNILKKTTAMV